MSEHDPDQGSRPDTSRGGRESAWDDVAAQFSNLGQQVRRRFERPTGGASADQGSGDSVRRWLDYLDETFTKVGDTIRDPAFRREAGSSVSRLGEALGASLTEFGERLQAKFGREEAGSGPSDAAGVGEPGAGAEPGASMPDVPPPPTTPTAEPPSSEAASSEEAGASEPDAGDAPSVGPDDPPSA